MAKILDVFPDPVFDPAETPGVDAAAILGGGCFWCTEGVFRQIPGVRDVISGYAGGDPQRATYKDVCDGDTGHVEVICVHYDPAVISYGQILKAFFWLAHDPTQVNGQGNDIGTQYRSAIFYTGKAQQDVAEKYMAQIDAAQLFDKPLATRLEKLDHFYRAEDYHQNYAALNPGQGYIQGVALPKIQKTLRLWPSNDPDRAVNRS